MNKTGKAHERSVAAGGFGFCSEGFIAAKLISFYVVFCFSNNRDCEQKIGYLI